MNNDHTYINYDVSIFNFKTPSTFENPFSRKNTYYSVQNSFYINIMFHCIIQLKLIRRYGFVEL